MSIMAFVSSIGTFFKSLRAALARTGVRIGGTAQLPRVEIHSIVEDVPLDKGMSIRAITATIECLSGEAVGDVVGLLDGNIEKLFADQGLQMTGYSIIGIMPGQVRLFDEQESQDTQAVFYRCLQDITVYIEKDDTYVS